MKRAAFILVFIVSYLTGSSQIDVKINPIIMLWANFDISGEYFVNDNIGIDASVLFNFGKNPLVNEGDTYRYAGTVLSGRYYFSQLKEKDGLFIGAYLKFLDTRHYKSFNKKDLRNTRLAIGPTAGLKISTKSRLVMEAAFGIGRAFYNHYDDNFRSNGFFGDMDIDLMSKLAVGYRF